MSEFVRIEAHGGRVYRVPEGLSEAGVKDYLISTGEARPEDFGFQGPEAGGNFLTNTFLGMGEFGSRVAGLPADIPAPGVGGAVGRAVPYAASGAALAAATGGASIPAQVGAQGLLAGGLSLAENKDPQAAAIDGLLASLLTGGTSILARSAGRGRAIREATQRNQAYAPELGRDAAQIAGFSRAGGGLNRILEQQQQIMKRLSARVFGFGGMADKFDTIDDAFLQQARTVVDATYRLGAPSDDVSIAAVKRVLGELPEGIDPRPADFLRLYQNADTIPASAWQGVQRTLRDVRATVARNPLYSGWTGKVDEAIGALDEAAELAGGDKFILGVANQRYKYLSTLEEVNAVVEAGELPAGELVRKLGRDGFKGYGRRAVAEGSETMLPEIADVLDAAKQISKFNRATAGGSPTAGRLAVAKPVGDALNKLATGNPVAAIGNLAKAASVPVTGMAATSTASSPGVRVVGGALSQAFVQRERNEKEQQRKQDSANRGRNARNQ